MRPLFEMRSFLRWASLASLALTGGACSSMQTLNEARLLPEMRTFLPSNSNTYSNATAMRTLKPAGPEDLVDGQGVCAGPAPADVQSESADGQLQFAHPIALEMTECQVTRALGAPANIEVGANERGQRNVVMTYTAGDRPGLYRFAAGRLVSMERLPQAAAPEKPEKKPGQKSAPARRAAAPRA